MNLLARARLSIAMNLIFPSPSPSKRLFNHHPVAALQQFNFYRTKTISNNSSKTQQLTKPRTQKLSEASSTTFSKRIKKQTDALTTVWPKPREIPYQEKVANFVNLIGYIKAPVQFEAASDGTHFAATVISQENIGEKNSLLIPVVFEGDLAHVVACHVKENDCVFVSGQLSVDPLRLVLSDQSLGKFHVVAENLNFVERFKRNLSDKYVRALYSHSAVEIGNPVKSGTETIEVASEMVDEDFKQQWQEALEHAKAKGASDISVDKSDGRLLNAVAESSESETINIEVNDLSIREIMNDKSGFKKKTDEQTLQLWRDLVKNPLQWWDYRGHKANGLVKEKHPDFKQKVSNESLWVNNAPDWIMPGFGKLEFDVKDMNPNPMRAGTGFSQGTKSGGKPDEAWKDLVANPSKWWDNRAKKKNMKQPDFKHKETGEPLWVNTAPDWVVSALGILESDVKDIQTKPMQAIEETKSGMRSGGKSDESWKKFVENPSKWWDNRVNKKNPKQPDFKHKETGEVLWLNTVPAWALSQIPPLKDVQAAC